LKYREEILESIGGITYEIGGMMDKINTGLFDKNGTQICVGNILKSSRWEEIEKVVWVDEWEDFGINNGDTVHQITDLGDELQYYEIIPEKCMDCYYIGEVVTSHTQQSSACIFFYSKRSAVVPIYEEGYSYLRHPQCPLVYDLDAVECDELISE
jgi:hypothetical protein